MNLRPMPTRLRQDDVPAEEAKNRPEVEDNRTKELPPSVSWCKELLLYILWVPIAFVLASPMVIIFHVAIFCCTYWCTYLILIFTVLLEKALAMISLSLPPGENLVGFHSCLDARFIFWPCSLILTKTSCASHNFQWVVCCTSLRAIPSRSSLAC